MQWTKGYDIPTDFKLIEMHNKEDLDWQAERDRLAAENAELRKEADEMAAEIVAAHFANATLDALREAVRSDEWIYAKHTDTDRQMERIEDILYPQPAALAEEKTKP